jgi:hypothetical protein
MSRAKRLLFIGSVWPEVQSSAAGVRAFSLLRSLKERDWDVHFSTPAFEKSEWITSLREMGIPARHLATNDSSFDDFISGLQPDYVVFDRFLIEEQFSWRVRAICPKAVRVLDTVDLHFLRRARGKALEKNTTLELRTEDRARELSSILRSDLSLVLSDFELRLLRELRVPEELLEYFPLTYKPQNQPTPAFSEREGYVMIGNFRHLPNSDAVNWLKTSIWPLIRAIEPQAYVDIYGAYPSREIMNLTDEKNGFVVRGPADDACKTLSRYRINLAPLRFGAGLKGKIADGWWAGTPVITTPVGAEGMRLSASNASKFGGRIAEDPFQIAREATELARSEVAWTDAQATGFQILEERFHEERALTRLLERFEALQATLEESRRTNWFGQALWHHTTRSTEYFSRWIELKEKQKLATPPLVD